MPYSLNSGPLAPNVRSNWRRTPVGASEIGVDLPTSIKKIVRAIKNGVYEPAPRAGVFRSRNELVLLARMFEANLQSNSQEALRLLATESLKPMA